MQLVDIGQVVSLPPRPMAEVTILSSAMALRVQPGSPQDLERDAQPPAESEPARPTPEQERSSPAAELAQDGQNPAQLAGSPAAPPLAGAGDLAGPRLAGIEATTGRGRSGTRQRPSARGHGEVSSRGGPSRRGAGLDLRAWLGLVPGPGDADDPGDACQREPGLGPLLLSHQGPRR